MSDKKTTQTQQEETKQAPNFPKFVPFDMDTAMMRWTEAMSEFASFQSKGIEQLHGAVGEYAKLTRAQLDYAEKLSTQLQKLAIDNTRRAAEAVRPYTRTA